MTPLKGLNPEWFGHGSTIRLRKEVTKQAELAHRELLSACRTSEDPDVARKFAAFDQLRSFAVQLGKADEEDGSTDGIDD